MIPVVSSKFQTVVCFVHRADELTISKKTTTLTAHSLSFSQDCVLADVDISGADREEYLNS